MKISFNWLKELVKLPWSPEETADKLAQLGFPVESITTVGVQVSQVISVKILSIAKHPNADRLQIAQVTDGVTERTIVCGAPNIAVGQIVPCALPGAKLPGGIEIALSKIRGVESHGMLCSERELNISESHAGILQLPPNSPLGKEVKDLLGGSDVVLDVEVTPNRPDMLSHVGVARELAALANIKIKWPVSKYKATSSGETCQVKIQEPTLCSRYTGKLIHGVTVAPSPEWIVRRLAACGIRSINNIVDITNYVLLEWGHPLHAFDLAKLDGKKIVVRKAASGEKLAALDEKTYELTPNDLIIADGKQPVAIAGIMGGQSSGVSQTTVDVLLESAVFDSVTVRKTSKRLNLRSESSIRFEKGTDAGTAEKASVRAAALILELADGKAGQLADEYPVKDNARSISLRAERLASLIGMSPSKEVVGDMLDRLDLNPKPSKEGWVCLIPSHRKDLVEEVDLIEEIIRLIGYDAIPTQDSKISLGRMGGSYRKWNDLPLIEAFRAMGFSETITSSFCSVEAATKLGIKPEHLVPLANPISKEETILRPQLLVNLLKAVQRNLNFQQSRVALFEIGKVFHKFMDGVSEEIMVSAVFAGSFSEKGVSSTEKLMDIFILKGMLENLDQTFQLGLELVPTSSVTPLHPYKAFDILWRKQSVGFAGMIHPTLSQALDITTPCALFQVRAEVFMLPMSVKTMPLPKYSFVERDIAVILDRTKTWGEVLKVATKAGGPLLLQTTPFDLFEGGSLQPHQKSLAFRVRLQHPDHTLTDVEINSVVDKIKVALQNACGAQPR